MVCVAVAAWAGAPAVMRGAYPLEYASEIAQDAAQYGLDPYRVAAVIRTESGFNPNAVSGAGARGLMQLMPETGEWIAGKLGVEGYNDDMLFVPETNISFGCWYLAFLHDRFGGKSDVVSAAYNAGHGRVSEWLADDAYSEGGELISIPFEETSKYVDRVSQAEKMYRKLYPGAFMEAGRS